MENSQSPNQPEVNEETTKEIKRHKSAHIPAGSEALNKIFNKDNSEDSNSFNLNQNTNPGLFKIKSTSSFVLIMSMISGFPSSAKNIKEILEQKIINDKEATKLLMVDFIHPPIFVVKFFHIKALSPFRSVQHAVSIRPLSVNNLILSKDSDISLGVPL